MRMNEVFLKCGYTCEINSSFRDLEGDTEREIDIVASKLLNNDINVHFVIECKQSVLDKWIFICTKGNSYRFYYGVKHLPAVPVEILKDKGLFSHFHTFKREIPVGHNYICYSLATSKKADHLQIDECVHKLPKALVDFASRVKGGRHLFFPVALFSGQIFAVSYGGSLVVQEKPFLQYFISFRSDAYKYGPVQILDTLPRNVFHPLGDWEQSLKRGREKEIRMAAQDLASPYQIDFTESGLPEYIAMVEKEVAAVRTSDWPLPTDSQEPAPS